MFVPRLTRSYWFLHLNGLKATANKPLTITFRTPDSPVPATETFDSLASFKSVFPGWGFRWNGVTVAASQMDHSHFDPARIYDAYDWPGPARREGLSHNQIADNAFEEKSIVCLERYLFHYTSGTQRRQPQPENATREDGWRYLTVGTDVAEWDGIWSGSTGRVYLLEAKHSIDEASFQRLFKTIY
ncbi:hypothetical protein BS47DRAFT_205036 [Hydnum rufescens UP504]|uniref:Uncharacterized protein n=1 Tax=Hydnum rufescens UP504 TaxID=1448309 RepID=A0A9P6AN00_9AGAM|nr:hypothetical protein BS47DRAFT_205036 [Hydnum rufescens UP504]